MECLEKLVVVLVVVSRATVVSSISVDDVTWWRRANFYQVYPRSFKDSDGDGTGDIRGVVEKAQYFKDIGVDAIWLSPFFTSPMKDFGYDVSDYKGIDPLFGNMDDFRSLSTTMEQLGVKLVIDFVPNHSSNLHPWFQLSCNRTDPYTDFYVWDDGIVTDNGTRLPPNNWRSLFGGSAWEWHEGRKQFYYHVFLKEQPDLNYNSPATRAAMEDVIRYWLDIGVDGFRLDAVLWTFESDNRHEDEALIPGRDPSDYGSYIHNLTMHQPKTFELLNDWALIFYNYSVAKGGKPRAMFLEVYAVPNITQRYYGHGNTSLMFPFNFNLMTRGNQGVRAPGFKTIIDQWLDAMPTNGVANWVVGNHDNGRPADRFGFEMVDAMNMLTGVLPGVKVTYNGDEIGQRNTFIRWDQTKDPQGIFYGPYHYLEHSRDPQRTPMQWDNTVNAGFSTNRTPWLPVNPDYWWLNVQQQLKEEWSHLKVFRALAKVRSDPVLLAGDCTVLAPDNDTLVVLRRLNSSFFALLINMGSEERQYTSRDLAVADDSDVTVEVVITSINVAEHKIGDRMSAKFLNIRLRPKAAILVRSVTSSAARILLSFTLLLCAIGNVWI